MAFLRLITNENGTVDVQDLVPPGELRKPEEARAREALAEAEKSRAVQFAALTPVHDLERPVPKEPKEEKAPATTGTSSKEK